MKLTETLIAARQLISDPARWTQHRMARDKYNNEVTARNSQAVKWCAMGAVRRVAPSDDDEIAACTMLDAVLCQIFPRHEGLSSYNDRHDHAEILALFDKAISCTYSE